MIIRVDADLALPVYEQIREQVVRMVVAGTIEPGTRLPTIRQLANDLQLAKGTIAKAYALLERANVVESRGHKGTFVLGAPAGPTGDGSEAAVAYVIAARQLGLTVDAAIEQIRHQWNHI